MLNIGPTEMVGIFIIALVLFGPKKLPELGRLLAKGLTEFRRAKNELKTTFESHLRELEKETNLESAYTPPSSITSSPSYAYSYDEYGQNAADAVESSTEASLPAIAPPAPVPEAVPGPVEGTIPRSNGIGHLGHTASTQPTSHSTPDANTEHEEHPA